jgi:hypothetical protein
MSYRTRRSHRLTPAALVAGVAWLILGGPTVAHAEDAVVKYRDHSGKTETIKDTPQSKIVRESLAGIELETGGGKSKANLKIPSTDIIDVRYVISAGSLDFNAALTADKKTETVNDPTERQKLVAEALDKYKKFETANKDKTPELVRRYVTFRKAMLKAQLAEADSDKLGEAADELKKYKLEHFDSWQTPVVIRTLASIEAQRPSPDFNTIALFYDDLLKNPTIPKELRSEATVAAAYAFMRAKRPADADKRAGDLLATLDSKDPNRERLEVIRIAAKGASTGNAEETIKKLQERLAKSNSPIAKAAIYNGLGEAYLAVGRKRDALWSFLWVDTVFNQDRVELIRAVEHLAKLFEEYEDDDRARSYKAKLSRLR